MPIAVSEWMRSPVLRCVVAAVALAGDVAVAADFQPMPGHAYNAVVDPKRPVSGHMVVGMSFGRGDYGTRLQAYLPGQPGKGTVLRIDIDSPDGRFLGTGLFVSDAPRSGWNSIELLSDAAKPVPPPSDLPRGELSVAATLVAGDAQRQNKMVPVRWADASRGDGETPLLRLYVNSRRAEKVTVSAGAGARAVDCQRVTARSVRRYDTICELELPRLPPGSDKRAVTVTRVDGFDNESQTLEIVYSPQ
jgi:hypothetical protein